MSMALIEAPEEEPVSLADMKAHLRVEHAAEDALIEGLILAARQYCEGFTRRSFIEQSWRLSLDRLPEGGEIGLPRPPLVSVDAVRIYDAGGEAETVSPQLYFADTVSQPGRLIFTEFIAPPGRAACGVEIDFTAGYGPAPEDVPEAVRQAVRLVAAHWYERRELMDSPAAGRTLPFAVAGLLAPFRLVSL
jgi:uncharacterized phiE125 gp8 family phage protein